jgi:hypothetical protein
MPGESHGITLQAPVGEIVLEEDAEVHGILLLMLDDMGCQEGGGNLQTD